MKRRYKRKTIEVWKFDALIISTVMLGFFTFCMLLNTHSITSENQRLVQKVYAQEVKEISVAEDVSNFGKLIEGSKVEPTNNESTTPISLKVSHYWPPLGGVNCLTFIDGECVSPMANGQPWKDHVEEAIACPKELPFGTKIKVLGEVWECKDRGGMIKKVGNTYWIDMLTPNPRIGYGTVVQGEIL